MIHLFKNNTFVYTTVLQIGYELSKLSYKTDRHRQTTQKYKKHNKIYKPIVYHLPPRNGLSHRKPGRVGWIELSNIW